MLYNAIYAAASLVTVFLYGEKRTNRVLYAVLLVFLFLFSAFRYEVGCDYYNYYDHTIEYSHLSLYSAAEMAEPGYWEATVLLRKAGLVYPSINVVAALLFFLGIHGIARRQPNPLMFLSLLFPVLVTGIPMSAVRQAMALGFLCFAFNAFADRKTISYLSWVLAAGLFHRSADLFLIATPLIYRRGRDGTWRAVLGLFLIAPALYIASRSELIEQYSDIYVGTEIDAAGAIFRVSLVTFTGIVMLAFYRKRWKQLCPSDYELAFYFSFACVAMIPLVIYSSVAGDRIGYYLMPIAG